MPAGMNHPPRSRANRLDGDPERLADLGQPLAPVAEVAEQIIAPLLRLAPGLINPVLKLGAGKPRIDSDMGYWPSYNGIKPAHRYASMTLAHIVQVG